MTDDRLRRLRRFNITVGFVHPVRSIAVSALSADFTLPVAAAFGRLDTATNTPVADYRTAARVFGRTLRPV